MIPINPNNQINQIPVGQMKGPRMPFVGENKNSISETFKQPDPPQHIQIPPKIQVKTKQSQLPINQNNSTTMLNKVIKDVSDLKIEVNEIRRNLLTFSNKIDELETVLNFTMKKFYILEEKCVVKNTIQQTKKRNNETKPKKFFKDNSSTEDEI